MHALPLQILPRQTLEPLVCVSEGAPDADAFVMTLAA
jgi:hypothetical protein